MFSKTKLLKGIENREEVSRILDKAEQALKTWEIALTDFFSPPILIEVRPLLNRLTEVEMISWGGYSQAERQRVGIMRSELTIEPQQIELIALDIAGNFLFDPANHRDFLGAILGTGIVREKVGDIIVLGERGGQVIVTPDIANFLETALVQVRSVPVKVKPISFEELKIGLTLTGTDLT